MSAEVRAAALRLAAAGFPPEKISRTLSISVLDIINTLERNS